MTVHTRLRMPFYHPVAEEELRAALCNLAKQLGPSPECDLPACGEFGNVMLDDACLPVQLAHAVRYVSVASSVESSGVWAACWRATRSAT